LDACNKQISSKSLLGRGWARRAPEEILLRISYRIVNAQDREKLEAVSFQAVAASRRRLVLPGTTRKLVDV
jgi:hypothetical protein